MNVCAIEAVPNRGEQSASCCGGPTVSEWVHLIQSEYFEMPGLHLTKKQVQRLWGLDPTCCDVVLNALESSKFLKRTAGDAYVRAGARV
jgi:hypothetical protein